jgi:hypothetical protein
MWRMTPPGAPNRAEALAGLALIAAWLAVAAWETLSTYPWNVGGVYLRTDSFVGSAASGVILVAAAVWLAGRSRAFRRS